MLKRGNAMKMPITIKMAGLIALFQKGKVI
jgi:hypothetical protein